MGVVGVDMERELELATLVHAYKDRPNELIHRQWIHAGLTFIGGDGEGEIEEISRIDEMCLHC